MREEETKGRKKKIGRKEQLGGRNSWEEGTVGRKEQLGGRDSWEEGTFGRKEHMRGRKHYHLLKTILPCVVILGRLTMSGV